MNFDDYLKETGEVGYVEEVVGPIVRASGLPQVKCEELVVFETGEMGQVLSLSEDSVEILTFSRNPLRIGSRVARTNRAFEMPVGRELLGQIIDPFARSVNQAKPFLRPKETRNILVKPAGIDKRRTIKRHMISGVAIVDILVPLGYGQRELLIGDRKTGKTDFLLAAILSQAARGTVCIYAAVGKRKIDIKKIENLFKKNNVMKNVIIVATTSYDPQGLIHLTPYSAMALAEFFRDQGTDTLLVIDDLTTHARFYREISLLGRRFPGRNSYPADIFHTHSRLMERAGNFIVAGREVSITVLPIAETNQGDLSGYIQTNLMSMTDGHLYFDANLFSQGTRPAINPFLSVTRVGQQTQSPLKRSISRELKSFLTLYQKTRKFLHFGEELSESIKTILATGDNITRFFHQPPSSVTYENIQIFLFAMLWSNFWKDADFSVIKQDMDKWTGDYEENKAFRERVDQIIAGSSHLNELLLKIKQIQTTTKANQKIEIAQ
jgi:F-type H+-transporting ATPase subunit alpha